MSNLYSHEDYVVYGGYQPSYAPYLRKFVDQTKMTNSLNPLVIDAGAGSGIYAATMAKWGVKVIAQDISSDSLFAAGSAEVLRCDFADVVLKDKVTGIHAKDVLGLDVDPGLFFSKATEIIKPLGIIMISLLAFIDNGSVLRSAQRNRYRLFSVNKWTPTGEEVTHDWWKSMESPERNILIFQKID
jgi:2-polyprenyl-3-methyl-5-hydroxy-6-metoxy-1,4-benzoquinol methylase